MRGEWLEVSVQYSVFSIRCSVFGVQL